MTIYDMISLAPLWILSSAAILIFFSISIKRNHKVIFVITVLSLMADFAFVSTYSIHHLHSIEPLLVIDGFGVFNIGLILLTTLVVTLISYAYFEQREERKEEYYILMILAALGAIMLVISKHFVSLFLGLEILSVSLYALIAYLRKRERSDEAGIKYLILAAFSSAFLLFGMALVYATTGSMEFAGIAAWITRAHEMPVMVITGFGMMIVGIGFKLGIVPFHMWAPDVYEGSPAPVTAFIATVSKGGMIALLVRFFNTLNGYQYTTFMLVFTILAIASMFIGNILALRQNNVKRLLAYSSIAHLGYVLVAFLAGEKLGMEAVIFYLVAYFITTLGAFGILATLSDKDRDAELLEDYRGLLWKRPLTAIVFSAMLLSLAGIPLTAGFVGKFYVIAAGIHTHRWLLVIILVINSVIGLYYYIKLIAVMFDQKQEPRPLQDLHPLVYIVSSVTMAILVLSLFWIGVNPEGMMTLIRSVL
ncbi:NADH-quinone oxidoreductase subunit N [Ohtaekwangia koreensis]|uniref:NADH-quinone oxidoreductase subunit N n=1 Tax=Ohtaekwangia koreensis TaxID=688867 RepID=A0A1T5MBC8_9BACT|nr:NADH-quinone oxidoreductase subunit N [Ohtaekwangia koreensis]SKC85520.1 NADH dehydrogenase subunit N [Ohtaekwangia koreensis]